MRVLSGLRPRLILAFAAMTLIGAAAAAGASYVDMNKVSEGHDACQPIGTRWIEPVLQGTNPVVVHPNALGEQQMAAQAIRVLHLR